MTTVIGIDAGLSCVKAAAFDAAGNVLAVRELPNAALHHGESASEVDMPALWELACRVVRGVVDQLPAGDRAVDAVGVTGHGNGAYLLNAAGLPVLGVSSMDNRAADRLERFRQDGRAREIASVVGGAMWAGQPLAILAVLPEPPSESHVLFCKDWIRYRLTGRLATDPTDASAGGLTFLHGGTWCWPAMEISGRECVKGMLPPIVESFSRAGSVTPEAAAATGLPVGTPVAVGGIDLTLGALGDDLAADGTLHVTAGTWAIHQVRVVGDAPPDRPADILQVIRAPRPGEHHLVESSPTCSINLDWLARRLGADRPDYAQWERWLASEPADGDVGGDNELPIYLPYPVGAWDLPDARAELVGDDGRLAPRRVVRAVYEGIVLGLRRQIDKYRRASVAVSRLVVTGGMTRGGAWCQMLSDAAGLAVEVADNPHAACWGAGLCALRAVGVEPAAASPVRKTYSPRSQRTAALSARYDRFIRELGARSHGGAPRT